MELEILETADQVFKALGDSAGVAELTRGKLSQVSNWKKFGSFPPKTYVVMTEALRAQGKTAPASLWRMQAASEPEHCA